MCYKYCAKKLKRKKKQINKKQVEAGVIIQTGRPRQDETIIIIKMC